MKRVRMNSVVLYFFAFFSCQSLADINGTVFRDFNADGSQQILEPGAAGMLVNAYDSTGGAVGNSPQTTAADGSYTLTGLPTGPLRIEFTRPVSGALDFYSAGANGSASNTSVVFASDGAVVNYAVNNPADFCQADPLLSSSCFVNGDPLPIGSAAGALDALVAWPLSRTGNTIMPDHIGFANQIGGIWGLAWNRENNHIYASAFLRRHVGMGPDGMGAIYQIDMTNPAAPVISSFISIPNAGLDPRVEDGLALPTDPGADSVDVTAFASVGKRALGDMDISDDNSTLYVMNLNNKSLVSIDIATSTITSTVAVNNPGCSADNDVQPFGVKYKDGQVYIGVVCSAQSTGNTADLDAYVMVQNGTSFTNFFGPVNMDYPRTNSFNNNSGDIPWQAWTDTFMTTDTPPGFDGSDINSVYPQPMLTDIEFDSVDGSLILGFSDRQGLQTGALNLTPDGSQTVQTIAAGDILRACSDGSGGLILENAGTCGGNGSGTTAGDGPGGGEFYDNEFFDNHKETTLGGLAHIAGSNNVIATVFDPFSFRSAGTRRFNNTNGNLIDGFQVFATDAPGTFGKAVGLGDVEALCAAAPIEIGNRVWCDAPASSDTPNGIQDPVGATGIPDINLAGVTVGLSCNSGSITASTITASDGSYLFNAANVSGGIPAGATCTLSIDTIANAIPLTGCTLPTVANAGSGPGQDIRDSDGTDNDNNNVIETTITVGGPGDNTHAVDFGLRSPLGPIVSSSKTDALLIDNNFDGNAGSGDTIRYTVVINNSGDQDATAVVFNSNVDSNTSLVVGSVTTSQGSVTNGNTGGDTSVTVNVGNLADGGGSVTITFDVLVNTPVSVNQALCQGTVTGSNITPISTDDPDSGGTDDITTTPLVTDVDLGDNPDTYSTVIASTGPTHTLSPGLFLGSCVDSETDGQPTTLSNGDDINSSTITLGTCATAGDDEDGVTNFSALVPGQTATVDVTSTGACTLDAWIDFNQNGNYSDPGEQIFTGTTLVNGTNNLMFAIPITATSGSTYSRFRCSSTGSPLPTGAASDGEVEDYQIPIENLLTLGDFVWFDTNQDGIQDVGEPGVNGIDVALYDNATCTGAAVANTVTATGGLPAADGFYQFPNLSTGTYCVEFTSIPAGYVISPANQGGDDTADSDADASGLIQNINLTANDPNEDMGISLDGSIAGITWCESDTNANTTYDAGDGDTLLPNIQVTLYTDANCSDTIDGTDAGSAVSQGTDGTGAYLFSGLPVGPSGAPLCYLTEVNQADTDLALCNTPITATLLGPDLDTDTPDSIGNDFGFEENITLGDFVWFDTNQNGIQDVGEPGVNGIDVALYDNATCTGAAVANTVTATGGLPAADGFYQFPNLSTGTYCVEFTSIPAGYVISPANQGGDDTADSDADASGLIQNINLTANDPNEDMGISLDGSIAGITWCESDTNANTTYDAGDGDTLLPNIQVTLYTDANCSDSVDGADAASAVTQDTDAAAAYLFDDLPVGPSGSPVCYITEVDTNDTDLGVCDTAITATLLPPDLDTDTPDSIGNDFGFNETLALGDYLWYDNNQNGQQDAGEPGVNGVDVALYNNATCSGASIDTTVTANGGNPLRDGYYQFTGLSSGDYCVAFSNLPTGYVFTVQNQGDDATDSDADTVTGQITNIILSQNDFSFDAGVYAAIGQVQGSLFCDDLVPNGLQDANEAIAGVSVEILRDNSCDGGGDVVIDTLDTDANGEFSFDNLPVALAPAPPNPRVCYVVRFDKADPELLSCVTPITPIDPQVEVTTDDPQPPNVIFGVITGRPPVMVPVNSWWALMLLVLVAAGMARYQLAARRPE